MVLPSQASRRTRRKLVAVARMTVRPSWFTASITVFMMPRSSLLCERRASNTVARTRSVSPGRAGPADLVQTRAAQARLGRQVVIHELAHDQGRRMPAAGDQPAERPVSRCLGIDVERLRIEL